jgi:uncharacterized repeat protein (TIGR02543 family)
MRSIAVIAAVLFGLAVGPMTAASASVLVHSFGELEFALQSQNLPPDHTIVLAGDVFGGCSPTQCDLSGPLPAVVGVTATLDLAGHQLSLWGPGLQELGQTAGLQLVQGGSLTIEDSVGGGALTTTGGRLKAGIELDGGSLTVNSGTVTATGGDNPYASADQGGRAAGIGGGDGGGGGSVTINGGTVNATGGYDAAGIGGGAGGNGGTVTINGGTVTAGGGFDGAGVGGGLNGPGGTLTVNGGTLHAVSGQFAAGIGGAGCGQGGDVTIGVAALVTAESAGSGLIAIGAGWCVPAPLVDPTPEVLPFGSLSNDGILTIPQSNYMQITSGATVTNTGLIKNAGAIIVQGTLDSTGVIDNTGSILVPGTLFPGDIIEHDTSVTLNGNGGTAPADPPVVYADSFNDGGVTFPPDPTWAGHTFKGWYTTPIGGSQVTDTTDLGLGGPKTLTLYAQWTTIGPAAQAITFTSAVPAVASVGGSYTVTAVGGGSGNPVTFSLDPSSSGCSISGATVSFTGVGTCVIDADQAGNSDYTAAAQNSQSITIGRAAQAITFTSAVPAVASVGGSYTVTAVGGGSGNPVVLSIEASSGAVCTISGSQVRFDHAGVCLVDANQAANNNYTAALPTQQSINIGRLGQSITFTSTAPAAPGLGSTHLVTATGGASGNPVTLSMAATTGGACTISGSTVTFVHPGSCVVQADQAGNNDYDAATPATQSIAVGQSSTATTLTVTPGALVARVRANAPGAGTPAGTVTFSVAGKTVGSQELTEGVATLRYTPPAGARRQIAAVYSGSTDYTGSSASSSRSDPAITATLSTAAARTKYGWYRATVTVSFQCTAHGAPLLTSCPDRYTFRESAAGQSVTRTIQSTDGGAATVTSSGINLDRNPPSVSIRGIRDHAVYEAAPAARCVAKDSLSGIASCKLGLRYSDRTTTVTAVATDRAGNTRSTRVSYTTLPIAIGDAPLIDGAFSVKAGHAYTLVVRGSKTRPIYYDAAVYPAKPIVKDHAFYADGHRRWVLGMAMDANMRSHTYWNLGVKIGATLQVIKIRVV